MTVLIIGAFALGALTCLVVMALLISGARADERIRRQEQRDWEQR